MPATIAVVGQAANKTSQSTTTITLSAAVASGKAVLVYVGHDSGGGTVASVADTAGNTYTQVGSVDGGDLHNVAFLSQTGLALASGDAITLTWEASPPSAKQAFAAGIGGLAAGAFYSFKDKAGTGPTLGQTSYNTPQGDDCLVAVLTTMEAPSGTYPGTASGFSRLGTGGTTGQGATSNVQGSLDYRTWEPATVATPGYTGPSGAPSADYLYTILVLKLQPLVIQTTSKSVAWRIQKLLQAPVAWSIPQRISAEVAWAIVGDGSYTPAPVSITSYTSEQPLYDVSLDIKSYTYVNDAETVIGRKRLYPIQITTLNNYSGSLSDIAEWPDPATDPTWITNTAVGQNAYSQLKVKFPLPALQPAPNQIFYWSSRKAPTETAAYASVRRGWSIDGEVPILEEWALADATPVGWKEFKGSAYWTTATIIELLLQSYNSYTGASSRGAWEPGAIAWDFIHEAQPEPGREIFIVSKTIDAFAELYDPAPVVITADARVDLFMAIPVTSVATDANSHTLAPVLVESDTGPRVSPQLLVASVALPDGEAYDLAGITITAEAALVDFDIQLNITAASATRETPELPIEAASAVPTATPVLAVESATSDPAVAAEIMVTSSARDGAIYPGLARTLTPYLTVGGVDLSSRLSGPWSVTREEGRVGIAEISLRPQPGVFDVSDAIRSPVRFGYRIDGADPVILFTGIVDEPAYDPHTRSLVYVCTDNLTRVVGAMPRAQIDALTPGAYWSPAAATQDADGWDYAQARMDTVPASLDLSIDGQPRMHAWEAAATPNFVFRDDPATGNFVDRTLRLSRASWREFVNEITLTVETRYQRRVQRDVAFNWSYTPTFQGYLTDTSPVPTEDTVRAAAEQAGWAIKSESFERLPPSGVYFGIIWTHNPDNPPFWILEAHLTLARRWDETITERTTYTVRAPASVARFGAIKETDRITYSPDPPADTGAWLGRDLDQRASSGAIYSGGTTGDLDGFTAAPGGVSYRDDTDPAATTAAHMVGLTRAARRILEAHRQHTAEVTSPLLPEIDTIHTAEVQATGLTYTGKVREVIHRGDTDIAAGPPTTTIRIALSQCDGAASVTSTPLTPAAITVPAPDVLTGQPALGGDNTHLGNRWYSPPEDPAWDGWISNYTIPEPAGATKYDERFVVDVGEYSREPVEVTASATFDVDVPHDPLLTTA